MIISRIPTFADRGRRVFRVVVESPRHATVKFKFDPALQAMKVSRPLTLGLRYPFDWGFVPGTRMGDGDPLDVMVLWDGESYPGVVLECRAIGVLLVEQKKKKGSGRERNDRVIAIPSEAPRAKDTRGPADLPVRVRREIEHFFVQVTAFEDKDIEILGWRGAARALQLVRQSISVSDSGESRAAFQS
jgi:inorganic pyrophosphatase